VFNINRLKKIRKEKGLTQLDLSKKTDIYPNNISQIENGKRIPFPGWKKRLAEALNVEEKELFPEEED